MVSRLTAKGQVTIPKPLRDSLGLEPGHELEFEERDGGLLVRRRPAADPLRQLVGLVGEPVDVDAYLDVARGAGWERSRDGEAG
ncbi:MAG: AbrB/MazE/SpoVT family DNA-binding domain-containing protein [Acidobacteriota bacterium]|nr:AbrB/MazE/SpoVT family DNA-binding domain-containing protein [Acidobacteriota bacterium]